MKFKNSIVGMVPIEWKVQSIQTFLTDYKGGAALKPSDFSNQGFPVIPKKAIQFGGKLVIDKKTFCLNSFASQNKSHCIDETYLVTTLRDLVPSGPSIGLIVTIDKQQEFILAQGVYGFLLNEGLLPIFLAHISNTDWYRREMRKIFVGSTQVHIRTQEFFDVNIPIPPLPEQKKIAKTLTSVDEVIEATETQINKLKDLKKGMMNELLTKGIGHTEFKDSAVGRIPVGWKVVIMIDSSIQVLDGDRGKEYPKENDFFSSGYCLFLSAKNVTKDGFRFNECSFVSKEKDEQLRKGRLSRNDIVITTRGTVGNMAYFDDSIVYDVIRINSGMAILRNNDNLIFGSFLFHLMKSSAINEQLELLTFGSAQPQLTIGVINSLKLLFPPLPEQQKIATILTSIDTNIEQKQTKLTQTKNLKKSLMADLLTGRVRVNVD